MAVIVSRQTPRQEKMLRKRNVRIHGSDCMETKTKAGQVDKVRKREDSWQWLCGGRHQAKVRDGKAT